jgi:hypothetical protein
MNTSKQYNGLLMIYPDDQPPLPGALSLIVKVLMERKPKAEM